MKRIVIIAVIFLLALWFIMMRHDFLEQAGSFLIYQDKIAPADAILVLGGGERERVLQGINLAKNKYADWMMFTGDHLEPIFEKPTHWALEAKKLAVSRGLNKDKMIPIINSDSTRDDALLSKEICFQKHFKSLIVVSEPYHTRRSHYVFNHVYRGTGIKIMMYPVQNSRYRRDTWWKYKAGFWDTDVEYQKMLFYFLHGYLF